MEWAQRMNDMWNEHDWSQYDWEGLGLQPPVPTPGNRYVLQIIEFALVFWVCL